MLSKGKLYSTLGHWGVGAFANTNLRTGDVAIEATANQTISSFDNIFPYMDLAKEVVKPFENITKESDQHEFFLLLNLNYMRYFKITEKDRFFKFYFQTLPDYYDYLPFWKNVEQQMIAKFTFHQDLKDSLFYHKGDIIDVFIELLIKKIKKKDPSFIQIGLSDRAIKDTMNIIKSRTFRISYKGWKILNNKIEEVQEDGIILAKSRY